MTEVAALLACGVAIAAALRSTWSPCGLSMLSTITPIGERGRRHRFRTTASWFVVGGLLGGACLGAASAALAAAYGALGLPTVATGALGAVAALVAAASDAHLGGFALPIHRRQVNERWLDEYRCWVYGLGFGWQIGCGLATYITSAAVYLMIVLSVLSGSPEVALAAGVLFGAVRGLSVLLGRRVTSTDALLALHRRLARLDERAGRLVVAADLVAAGVLVGAAPSPATFAIAALAVAAALATRAARPGLTAPSPAQDAPDSAPDRTSSSTSSGVGSG